jgi:2-polyprenyl-6-methoxyphenol hydroxylase-like FAD-dependent oxidoreductase
MLLSLFYSDIRHLTSYSFYEVPTLKQWSSPKGRVIVMGDAAHAFSPQGGQGAAMSFEDAETLGITMSRPDFESNRQRLLNAWQNHRQERVKRVKAFTDNNAKLRTPTNSWIRQVIKDWVMWAFLTYKGPLNGMEWLYGYDGESVVKALRES